MRALELILLLSPLPVVVSGFWGRPVSIIWGLLPALVLVLHAGIEGLRWQLAPLYLLTAWLLVVCAYPRPADPGRWATVASIALMTTAAVAGTLLPVFRFPALTGPYPVGTVMRHLVDPSRIEIHDSRAASRELMVQIWYPAAQNGSRQPYRSWPEVTWKTENLAYVKTDASINSLLSRSPSRFPVIVFTPSWTGRQNQCTFQAQELASQGFVVVGINHPYSSILTVFPDQRIVQTELGDALDFSSDEASHDTVSKAREEIQLRSSDVRFVLDELERWDQEDREGLFTGRLAVDRIGVYGYSFGGAVAAEVARKDPRVKVAANLDGAHFDRDNDDPIGRPFLFFMSEETYIPGQAEIEAVSGSQQRFLQFLADDTNRILASMETAGGFAIKLNSAQHANFCDSPLYTPIRRLTGAGPIPPRRAMRIINAYLCAFFRQELLDSHETLLLGPAAAQEGTRSDAMHLYFLHLDFP